MSDGARPLRRLPGPRGGAAAGDRRRGRARARLGLVHPGPRGRGLRDASWPRALGRAHAVARGQRHRGAPARAGGAGRGRRATRSSPRPLTAAFTGLAILRAGARPVFADVDPRTLNVVAGGRRRARSRRARKALLPVHLYGHPGGPRPAAGRWPASAASPLVEDACQAHGARYRGRPVGALVRRGRALLLSDQEPGRARRRRAPSWWTTPALRGAPAPAAQRRPERPLPPRGARASTAGSTRCRPRSCAWGCATCEAWTERRRALAALYLRELAGRGRAAARGAALRARGLPPLRGPPPAPRRARGRA